MATHDLTSSPVSPLPVPRPATPLPTAVEPTPTPTPHPEAPTPTPTPLPEVPTPTPLPAVPDAPTPRPTPTPTPLPGKKKKKRRRMAPRIIVNNFIFKTKPKPGVIGNMTAMQALVPQAVLEAFNNAGQGSQQSGGVQAGGHLIQVNNIVKTQKPSGAGAGAGGAGGGGSGSGDVGENGVASLGNDLSLHPVTILPHELAMDSVTDHSGPHSTTTVHHQSNGTTVHNTVGGKT